MSVKIIGLKTGEQILGKVEEVNGDFLVKKPAILVPAGDKGIGIAPWMPYTKATDGILIKSHALNFVVDPVDEMVNHYNGTFVGGLVVPSEPAPTPQLALSE